MPEGDCRDQCVVAVAYGWAAKDTLGETRAPDAAFAWASHLPEGSARLEAVGMVVLNWISTRPGVEVAARVRELPDGELRDEMTVFVVGMWSLEDGAVAAGWAGQLPEGMVKDCATSFAANQWTGKPADRQATAGWVRKLKIPRPYIERLLKMLEQQP